MKNAKNQLNKSLRALLLAVLFAVSTFAGVRVGFAAYSSVQNVKRVVQLSKKVEDVLFSSNYLSKFDQNENNYGASKLINFTRSDGETAGGKRSFVVTVNNFDLSNNSLWNDKDINYKFKVTALNKNNDQISDTEILKGMSVNETPFTNGVVTVSGTLSSSRRSTNSYTITLNENYKDIKLKVEALPKDYGTTKNYKLCKIFEFGEISANTDVRWTGTFSDAKVTSATAENNKIGDLDGFNYRLAGSKDGQVTLTWNKKYVDISPIFVEEISNKKKSGTENNRNVTYDRTNNSITFDVFATDKEFILQFYRTSKPTGEMWDPTDKTVYVLDNETQKNKNYVTFSFTENTSSSGGTGGSTAAN